MKKEHLEILNRVNKGVGFDVRKHGFNCQYHPTGHNPDVVRPELVFRVTDWIWRKDTYLICYLINLDLTDGNLDFQINRIISNIKNNSGYKEVRKAVVMNEYIEKL